MLQCILIREMWVWAVLWISCWNHVHPKVFLHSAATSISVPAISLEGQGKPLGHFLVQASTGADLEHSKAQSSRPGRYQLGKCRSRRSLGCSWSTGSPRPRWVPAVPPAQPSTSGCASSSPAAALCRGKHKSSVRACCSPNAIGAPKGKADFFFCWMGTLSEGWKLGLSGRSSSTSGRVGKMREDWGIKLGLLEATCFLKCYFILKVFVGSYFVLNFNLSHKYQKVKNPLNMTRKVILLLASSHLSWQQACGSWKVKVILAIIEVLINCSFYPVLASI